MLLKFAHEIIQLKLIFCNRFRSRQQVGRRGLMDRASASYPHGANEIYTLDGQKRRAQTLSKKKKKDPDNKLLQKLINGPYRFER